MPEWSSPDSISRGFPIYLALCRKSHFVDQSDISIILNSFCFPVNVRFAMTYLGCGASLVVAKMNSSPSDLADMVRQNKVTFPITKALKSACQIWREHEHPVHNDAALRLRFHIGDHCNEGIHGVDISLDVLLVPAHTVYVNMKLCQRRGKKVEFFDLKLL